jgi:hypothetical protein
VTYNVLESCKILCHCIALGLEESPWTTCCAHPAIVIAKEKQNASEILTISMVPNFT